MSPFPSTPRLLACAVALALLAGCGRGDSTAAGPAASAAGVPAPAAAPAAAVAPAAGTAPPADAPALVAELAGSLQACSYDGAPVRLAGKAPRAAAPGDCRDMVARIMQFTGLPQNFDVVEAPVPNAAAVILLDEHKLPHRVIAFNRDFMEVVRRATRGNAWAPISVMAHEIGHHLSGHTITPGGSQPPTELEADKFSGFVLYKMGAALGDAQQAMAALVEDGPDGPTHPGRRKRLAAIAEGWQQACAQQKADCSTGAVAVSTAPAAAATTPPRAEPATAAPPPVDRGAATAASASASVPPVATPAGAATASASAAGDVIPAPGSTPSKFNRFVYDAFGVLGKEERARVEQKMFALARDSGVEVVTLLTDDLHGMSANDYAYAMMRQLRVGKLDVGNGAVIVVAPRQNDVAIAIGPGLMIEAEYLMDLNVQTLRSFLDDGWAWCQKKGDCGGWTSNFFGATERIAGSGKHWEWTIRYPSLVAMKQVAQQTFDARQQNGGDYDPEQDPTWRKIARFAGTVVSLTPDKNDRHRFVNTTHEGMVGPAVLVRDDDGGEAMLYVNAHAQALMPAGKLVEGRHYSFVVREASLSNDPPQLDLLSYDAL